MKFQNKYRVDSTRLPHWDYSNPGMYFVTICTKKFQHCYGDVADGIMVLNDLGNISKQCWQKIPNHFEHVKLDKFIVMPNHVHGIITIVETRHAVSLPEHINKFGPLKKRSLSTIIGSYKSAVTREIRKNHNPKFAWQPRFYDHVIRNKYSLEKIQNYIHKNPENWEQNRNVLDEDRQFVNTMKNVT